MYTTPLTTTSIPLKLSSCYGRTLPDLIYRKGLGRKPDSSLFCIELAAAAAAAATLVLLICTVIIVLGS